MNNKIDKYNLKSNLIGNELVLTWDKNGEYHSVITFEWRSRVIHMLIDVDTSLKSRTDVITINIDGETSRFGVGRAFIGAGVIGKQPKIETHENYLSITQEKNRIIIKDKPKETKALISEGITPFKIINIPSCV
jgi:hypothetical protein